MCLLLSTIAGATSLEKTSKTLYTLNSFLINSEHSSLNTAVQSITFQFINIFLA